MALSKNTTALHAQPAWQKLSIVLLFNTLIALFLHIVIPNSIFLTQVILSHSIGLSIFLCYLILFRYIKLNEWITLIPLLIGLPLGITVSITIQALIVNATFDQVIEALGTNYRNILTTLFIGLFFGAIVSLFFVYRERIFRSKARLQTEQIKNLDQQKIIAETQLRLLQAQIEPHFLFNTLANVISLIDKDPEKSKQLLESFTEFLRSTLKRSTERQQNLENEITLIEHYLQIMKLRIGERLAYHIHVQGDATHCALPPLLIQPLVENAIIHGIEPVSGGGRIDITIKTSANKLVIMVSDTGKGLTTSSSKGFGLSNLRERLRMLYKNQGHLVIEDNKPSGVTATIEVPCETL